jgi:hypothetical protein
MSAEPAQAGRQQVGHEHRECALRIRADRFEAGIFLLEQRHGDHAGNQEYEDRGELEIRREDRAAARFLQPARGENPLRDVLIGTPVPEADDRRAEQHAEPRCLARVEQKARKARGRRGRRQRAPQMNGLRVGGLQRIHAADLVQPHDEQHDGTAQQYGHVHRLGPQHGLHAAEHHEHARDDDERGAREPEEIGFAENRQVDRLVAEDGLDRKRAGEDGDRCLGEDVRRQENSGEQRARGGCVAPFEELGRREHVGA